MISLEIRKYEEISPLVRMGRTVVGPLINLFLRKQVIRQQPDNGLSRLEDLAKQGYGSVIISIHPTSGEPPRIVKAVRESPVFGDRRILTPFAVHEYKSFYSPVIKLFGVTVCLLTTDGTQRYVEQHPDKKAKYAADLTPQVKNRRAVRCLGSEIKVLQEGGVAVVFIQGERQPYLESITSALESLVKKTDKLNFHKFAVTFMGVEVPGRKDYYAEPIKGFHPLKKFLSVRGLNLFQKYILTDGATYTKEELLQKVKEKGGTINDFVMAELLSVAPPSYSPRNIVTTA